MIINGFGFAWLPLPLIEKELRTGQLKQLPLQVSAKRNAQLHLLFNDAENLGPVARTFLGELRYQSMNLPTSE
jgi:DNA-binding transcriptional LysR family regulator